MTQQYVGLNKVVLPTLNNIVDAELDVTMLLFNVDDNLEVQYVGNITLLSLVPNDIATV